MKRFILPILCLCVFLTPLLEARGGRGGGGRGGGGGRSVNRSPSMSRATAARQPSRDRQQGVNRPRENRNSQSRNDVQRYLKDNPVNRSNINVNRPVTNTSRWQGNRNDFGNNVRRDIRNNRPGINNAFDRNLWAWGTAAGVGAWLGWQAAPVYYDYYGYDNPSRYGSSSYVEAGQTINAVPASSGSVNTDWMPLGVFALAKAGDTITTPQMYIQLALNKQGDISGTFFNSSTNQTYELEGAADKDTQRVAWKKADSPSSPIMETGLYNLTQPESPVTVHFSNGSSQQMLLVRLDSN